MAEEVVFEFLHMEIVNNLSIEDRKDKVSAAPILAHIVRDFYKSVKRTILHCFSFDSVIGLLSLNNSQYRQTG